MMIQKVIEGTWEEIAQRGLELTGCRVRVTVLEEAAQPVALDERLASLIKDAESLSNNSSLSSGAVTGDAWSEGVLNKYRRQGLGL